MNNADLAEIRALLRESAPPERPPRKGLLPSLGSLLRAQPRAASKARTPAPVARRVGLRPAEPEAPETPVDAATEANEAAARRRAFGQRHDPASDTTPPLLLLDPAPPDPELESLSAMELILRRRARGLLRAANPPQPQPPGPLDDILEGGAHETPYHPEDLFDPVGAAEEVYDASGLFAPRPPAPPAAEMDPERELLAHLERVCLAEQAGLLARRL